VSTTRRENVNCFAVADAIQLGCSQDLDDAWGRKIVSVFKKESAHAFALVCPRSKMCPQV
jgi:hypothetical protein